jgi:hypothetical protein
LANELKLAKSFSKLLQYCSGALNRNSLQYFSNTSLPVFNAKLIRSRHDL